MADGYEVIVDALVAHATALGRVQDGLSTALDAAQQVSLPRDAYGLICQFFPPMVDPVEQSGVTAISAGVRSVGDTITAVADTARAYDLIEHLNTSSFDGGR